MITSGPPLAALTSLGLGKPQAEAYLALIRMSVSGSPTGYQVAKHLGKDPTSVYKALADLEKLGAVEVVGGRGRRFRPIDPEDLVRHLSRDYQRRARQARRVLAALRPAPPTPEVLRLSGRDQLLDRFRALIERTEHVALLQLDHKVVRALRTELRRALHRGVRVLLLGGEPVGRAFRHPLLTVIAADADRSLQELMPAPLIRGVFDAGSLVVGFLPDPPGSGGHGYWTTSRLLAYREHLGLAMEMAAAEVHHLLARETPAPAIRDRFQELLHLAHASLDWEALWDRIALPVGPGTDRRAGPGAERPAARELDRPSEPRWRDLMTPAQEPLTLKSPPSVFADHTEPTDIPLAYLEPPSSDDVLDALVLRRRRWQKERDRHAEPAHPEDPRHHPDQ